MKKKLITVALALTFVLTVCMSDYATGLYIRAEAAAGDTPDIVEPEPGDPTGPTIVPVPDPVAPPNKTTPNEVRPQRPSGTGSTDNTGSDSNAVVGSTTLGQVITETVLSGFFSSTTVTASVSGATYSQVVAADAASLIAAANSLGGTFRIATIIDIHVPAGTGAATFTLGVPGLVSGQSVTVLHLRGDGAVERLPVSSVNSGSVTFTMTSYSPVAVIINESSTTTGSSTTTAGSSSSTTGSSSSTTGTKAPQTGDTTNMSLIIMIAVAGLAGVVICEKKKLL